MGLVLTEDEKRWLTGLAQFDEGNRLAFLAICAGFRIPHSYLDVGCGTGAMVKVARQLGVDAHGVDILPHEEPWLYKQDLTEPFDLHRQFDLVTCIETAEHIPESGADALCDTLVRHVNGDGVNSSGLLILTAAPPGQLGDGHINCQPLLYWRDRLQSRGLWYREAATKKLVTMWEQTHWATHWCEQNLQVFSR